MFLCRSFHVKSQDPCDIISWLPIIPFLVVSVHPWGWREEPERRIIQHISFLESLTRAVTKSTSQTLRFAVRPLPSALTFNKIRWNSHYTCIYKHVEESWILQVHILIHTNESIISPSRILCHHTNGISQIGGAPNGALRPTQKHPPRAWKATEDMQNGHVNSTICSQPFPLLVSAVVIVRTRPISPP